VTGLEKIRLPDRNFRHVCEPVRCLYGATRFEFHAHDCRNRLPIRRAPAKDAGYEFSPAASWIEQRVASRRRPSAEQTGDHQVNNVRGRRDEAFH